MSDGFLVTYGDVFVHYNHLLRMTSLHIHNPTVRGDEQPQFVIYAKHGRSISAEHDGKYVRLDKSSPLAIYAQQLIDHHHKALGVDEALAQYILGNTFKQSTNPPQDE